MFNLSTGMSRQKHLIRQDPGAFGQFTPGIRIDMKSWIAESRVNFE